MPAAVADSNAAACRHCAQPLVSARHRQTGFCCSGCRAAFQLIHGLGLDYFYSLRARTSELPQSSVIESKTLFDFFDDPTFATKFIHREAAGASRITLALSGIHCAACVWLLEKLPDVLPGIDSVRADLVRGRIVVRFREKMIRPRQIARTVSALGYPPVPVALEEQGTAKRAEDRVLLQRIGVAAFGAMNVMLLFFGRHQGYLSGMEDEYAQLFSWASLILTAPVVIFSAVPFYRTSWAGLRARRLHIDLPIALAISAGFLGSAVNTVLGRPEIYYDSVAALVFLLLVGRWFQQRALRKVADASDTLLALMPLAATRVSTNGRLREVYIGSVRIGDRLRVATGESFPADGRVVSGTGQMSVAILTGESAPVEVRVGDAVFAGGVNLAAPLDMEVSALGYGTRFGKIIAEACATPGHPSRTTRFVDRVSVFFVVGVLILAALTFLIWIPAGFAAAWDRVIALLVVSCPCALGIATPITLSLASARAARHGVLVKNGDALERLAHVTSICFDKTGTLTSGEFEIVGGYEVSENGLSSDVGNSTFGCIQALESHSQHPIARAFSPLESSPRVREVEVHSGRGVCGIDIQGIAVQVGSLSWLQGRGIRFPESAASVVEDFDREGLTRVGFASGGVLRAIFGLRDALRPDAVRVVQELRARGCHVYLLTGDVEVAARRVGRALGLPSAAVRAELSPEAKAQFVDELGLQSVFVGDGVNDGLALARAGVGIGIHGGAELALGLSDLYLLRADLRLVVDAVDASRRALSQIHRHLAISACYNVAAATLAISGLIGPLAAAFVMPLSSLSVICSSFIGAPFSRSKFQVRHLSGAEVSS